MTHVHHSWRPVALHRAIILVATPLVLVGAQAPVRQARVDVVIPSAPAPVIGNGKRVLAYEVHVTNFGITPLELTRLDVFAGDNTARQLLMLSDSALRNASQAVGTAMSMSTDTIATRALTIDAGRRAVVFIWLSLPSGDSPPPMLRHRLSFVVLDGGGRAESVIDGVTTTVSSSPAPDIAMPVRTGDWLAGNGPANDSPHRRALVPLDGHVRISQRFAMDLVKIGANGNTWHDDRTHNENFWGYGEPVIAVADGEIVSTLDSIPDNTPGKLPSSTLATISGNRVIMRIDASHYAMYAHLQRGSVAVHSGQRVKRGDVIGRLGNSGQATGPHLHFQVMDAPSDLGAEGTPYVFDAFTSLGPGSEYETDKHPTTPIRRELPIGDIVIRPADVRQKRR